MLEANYHKVQSKKRTHRLGYHEEYKPNKILRGKQLSATTITSPQPSVRQGKWSPEEERQTEQIIADFYAQNLPDCSNGCSLRSYLADKLNSSKMRISKKLAHRSLGSVSATLFNRFIDEDTTRVSVCMGRVLYVRARETRVHGHCIPCRQWL